MTVNKGEGEGIGLQLVIEPGLVNLVPVGGIRLFESDDEDIILGKAIAHAHFVGGTVFGDLGQDIGNVVHPVFSVIGAGSVDVAIGLMVAPDRVGDVQDGSPWRSSSGYIDPPKGLPVMIDYPMNLIAASTERRPGFDWQSPRPFSPR